jgi:hypothetical protein
VLVAGPAGAGKSRLAEEFAATSGMATVVWGRGTESTHRASLRPWRQVIGSLEGRTGQEAERLHGAHPSDELPDQSAAVLATAERVLALARRASSAGPVLIVVEDLHWLDDPSLQVARIVLGELTDARVMIVATVRDDDGSVSPALTATLAELARGGARRIDLPPLSQAEVATYVTAVTGTADPDTAAQVFARTAGHPFFVVELTRLLVSYDGTHALASDSAEVPGGVRDVVRARLSRLPGPTRAVLAAAAVLQDHATLDLLEAASGVSSDGMLDAVEPALVTRVVVFTGTGAPLSFTHSLVRQVVAEEVTSLRRARMLAAAAEAALPWETDPARVPALADLALAATEAGGPGRAGAVALARSAAPLLAVQGSFTEAAALLRRALDQSRHEAWPLRHEVLVELARYQLRAGDVRGWICSIEEALELALEQDDWEAGGRSLGSMLDGSTPWSWLSYGGVRSRPVELLTRLLTLTPTQTTDGMRVTCLATAVLGAELYFTGDTGRCLELSRRALELARQIDDPALFGAVVALSEMAVWAPDGARRRVALRHEALARGLPPEQEAAALYRTAVDLYQLAEAEAADEALSRCEHLVSRRPSPGWSVALGHLRASRLVATGRFDAGEQLALETYQTHRRTTMGAADAILTGLLLSIRLEQGRLAQAQPVLEQVFAADRPALLRDAPAFVLAYTGRFREAQATFAGLEPTSDLADDGLLTGRLAFRAFASYCLARAGHTVTPEEVTALGDRLRFSAGQVVMHGGGIGVWGAVDLFLGMSLLLRGDLGAASASLREAVAVNDRAGNVPWGARSRRLLSSIGSGAGPGELPAL